MAVKKDSIPKSKKKNFSSFRTRDAFKQLGITELLPWAIEPISVTPSAFFQQRLERLQKSFDLQSYEESKKLLIDAICEEAIDIFDHLKIWKGAQLEGSIAAGFVDYLITERKRYIEAPLLCITEAKKDDFEQGLAQYLVEMQACQWKNQQSDRPIDVLGIVTNGTTWQFYKLTIAGSVYETPAYSLGDQDLLLGRLRYVFQLCEDILSAGVMGRS
jgi:hypothetical protein